MARFVFIAFYLVMNTASVYPARILGVFPMPSVSHQVVFRALTLELVQRGHEMVSITPDPAFKNKESPFNLTEIDVSESYKMLTELMRNDEKQYNVKRGVIMEFVDLIQSSSNNAMSDLINQIFYFPQVKKFMSDKKQKFDLIIMEGLGYAPLIFSEIYNAPVILITSLYGTPTNYEALGAVARHPLLHPYMFRIKYKDLSIIEKIKQLHVEYRLWKFDQDSEMIDNSLLKSIFGPDTPTVAELKKNVVLLFANSHPIFDGNRPVPPGVVYLGGLHMVPKKKLPQDLRSYLDNSSRGVVYVSLGTNVNPLLMDKEFLNAFLDAFTKIPFDILWKFDGDNFEGIPKNVKIQKWFPQRDLLSHPNIKLFVMQGGLQSTDEAIDAEVPLVGIPMLADQWYNVNKYVELGIGVEIDSYTMVADDLVKAVNTVANNPSYKENMKKLKAIMQDQPEKPIDRGVWWVEHVLRHKGSRHLLGPAAQMSWCEYLMLDVIILLAFTISVILVTMYYMICVLFRLNKSIKMKQH